MLKTLLRRGALALALAATLALGAAAQVPGRVNPLPGLTGLGANALPGLISPLVTSSVSTPAGFPTTWRWNSGDASVNIVLSNGNRTATSLVGDSGVRGNMGQTTGKGYYEIIFDTATVGNTAATFVGYGNSSVSLTTFSGGAYTYNQNSDVTAKRLLQIAQQTTATLGAGGGLTRVPGGAPVTLMIALDMDNLVAFFGFNGNWIGDPSAGTGAPITGIAADTYFPQTLVSFSVSNNASVTIPIRTAYPAPTGYPVK